MPQRVLHLVDGDAIDIGAPVFGRRVIVQNQSEWVTPHSSPQVAQRFPDMSPPLVATAESQRTVYCPTCQQWLSGPTDWEEHRTSQKHKKNKEKEAEDKPDLPMEASLPVQDLRGTSPKAPPGARWVPGPGAPGPDVYVRGVAGDTSSDSGDSDLPALPA